MSVFLATFTLFFLVFVSGIRAAASPLPCPSDLCKCLDSDVSCTDRSVKKISWDFPALTSKISLANNSLSQVNASNFLDAASTILSLDLSRNHLSLLPGDLLDKLTEVTFLNFSRNTINIEFDKREDPLIQNTKLQTLDLSHNRIQFIAPILFQGLKFLKHLFLDGNFLTHFTSFYFTDSPTLSTISLSNNRIEMLTRSVQFSIKKLDLSGNTFEFTNTSQFFLSTPDVQELKIGHPGLTYYENSFVGMTVLHKVELIDYSQRRLSSDLFCPSRILRTVEVIRGSLEQAEFSNVKYLNSLSFTDLANMTSVRVTSCMHFGKGSLKFTNVPKLGDVSLNRIRLVDFDSSLVFPETSGLKSLNLSTNYLRQLTAGMFDNVPDLEVLDLSYNRIDTVENTAILSLTKLKLLSLKGNILASVSSNFLKSNSLLSLNLAYNLIKDVSKDALGTLPSVNTLNLGYNPISRSPPIVKSSLSLNLEGIDSWECNCELYDFIVSEHLIDSCRNTSTTWCHVCASPLKYKGQTVLALQHECATEDFPSWLVVIIAVAAGVLCACAVIALYVWKVGICRKKKRPPTRIPSYYTPPQERAKKQNLEKSNHSSFLQESDWFTQSPAKLVNINENANPQEGANAYDSSGDEVFVTS